MVILLYLSRGIVRTYLGGQGEVQMVEWFILKGSLCLTSNLIFLVISWRNANYRIYLNQIRSQSYKNTSCTRFDREGTRSTVLCSLYDLHHGSFFFTGSIATVSSLLCDCQIQGKFKDGKFDNKNYFRYKKDIKVKTWKHINNFCCKGSKHPFS